MPNQSNFRVPLLRYLWASPLTLFGVTPALIVWALRGQMQVVDGVLEVHGPLAKCCMRSQRHSWAAFTIGHIVIARDKRCCEFARAHEREHVRQSERWGPLFPFVYCGAGAWQALRGRRFYWDNPFEVAARRAEEATE